MYVNALCFMCFMTFVVGSKIGRSSGYDRLPTLIRKVRSATSSLNEDIVETNDDEPETTTVSTDSREEQDPNAPWNANAPQTPAESNSFVVNDLPSAFQQEYPRERGYYVPEMSAVLRYPNIQDDPREFAVNGQEYINGWSNFAPEIPASFGVQREVYSNGQEYPVGNINTEFQ